MAGSRSAVFLDRDGVLNCAVIRNGKPHPPDSLADFRLAPFVREGCAALKEAGFLLIVVTNQPDVARGTQKRENVEAMNDCLARELPIDAVFVCFHDDKDACDCRKPKPGLLLQGALSFGVDLSQSFLVGDRYKDIDAGRAAGVKTVFLDFEYAERKPEQVDFTARSFGDAVSFIIKQRVRNEGAS